MKHSLFSYLALSLISIVLPNLKWLTCQLLREKELHSFVANLLRAYDYAYDTKVDIWTVDRFQDLLVHYLLMNN
jgi:nitrate reductase alpha subunit